MPTSIGSVNPSRRAKQLALPQRHILSDSESDAGQDSDQDSDFHPGVDLGRSQSFSHTSGTPHWADRTANTPILPRKGPAASAQAEPAVTSAPPPARRGRKPSGLSRSAREAQRKLNHSIIEKARRTKINDALATLRELIPADYGRTHEEDEEDEPDQGKKGGKKEKKEEKEFKLEILVRTVSFMKNLLERIRVLEAAQQGARDVDDDMSSAPVQTSEGKKRKRRNEACDDIQDDSRNDDQRRSKKRHVEAYTSDSLTAALPHQLTDLLNGPSSLGAVHPSDPTTNSTSHQSRYTRTSRLPSISSWLNTVSPLDSPGVPPISPNTHPLANIDPALRALPQRVEEDYSTADPESKKYSTMQAAPHSGSYLPSPPPSTRFYPLSQRAGHNDVPAPLNLGEAYAVDARNATRDHRTFTSASGPHTPDEDFAASMLLEISASLTPPTLPISTSPRITSSTSAERLSLSPPTLMLAANTGGKYTTTPTATGKSAPTRKEVYLISPRLGPEWRTEDDDILETPRDWERSSSPAKFTTSSSSRVRTNSRTYEKESHHGPLTPQTPSSLLGMGGVERVMSRLGLGAREVTE
ncbi:hypothetical protein BDN71DRAFT_1512040 [Pleurotus eryngii]|uniref:BHLH domain-containing protein n=1 Tax=Pleurotus eryngii TaxID=5323 RepID=A0A9P6D3D0_PLEER|nr:hypothetical protein BDN71DRAFT_1512040 [Pleurotus eryngii]